MERDIAKKRIIRAVIVVTGIFLISIFIKKNEKVDRLAETENTEFQEIILDTENDLKTETQESRYTLPTEFIYDMRLDAESVEDYYIKINFLGSKSVVDALGGITIDSEVEFTNGEEAAPVSYHFVKGENECDGDKTIAFARERKAFTAGDFQRGRNQTAVIKGIIQKAMSPAILTKYSAVMDAVSDLFLTNIPNKAISELVKAQLSNNTPWNIQSYGINGATDEKRHLEVVGAYNASIVLPYVDDIKNATAMMNKVLDGEVFDVDEYVSTHESSKETMDPLNNKNSSGSSTTSKTTDTTKTAASNKTTNAATNVTNNKSAR